MTRRVFDISQTIRPGIPVWPGDTAFKFAETWTIDDECPVNVGSLELSTHTGTHTDAPLHYDEGGLAMAEVPIDAYIGPCIVIDATGCKQVVRPEDIAAMTPDLVERVIFKTYKKFPHNGWDSDFTAVHPDTASYLAERGCKLIGLDSPSLDPEQSKTLDCHMRVRDLGLAVLEGLVLDSVEPGAFELIALPLKIAGADASPVRAILRAV